MAKLSTTYVAEDQTLAKIDEALEQKQSLEAPRNYMGMSMIGDECWRKVFYDFHNVRRRVIKSSGIKAIQDGFKQEDIMAERLRLLPYIELITLDPEKPGEQIGIKTLLGHFCGHVDGVIRGIIEAPRTWHVWENKAVNEEKFEKLKKLKEEKGEKNALKEWDIVYYGQAQLYMHFLKLERHYLTVQSPGGRKYTSARTEYNRADAEALIEKARILIFEDDLPARISNKRDFYKCKDSWCAFCGVCHDGEFADVNCKTCRYRECIDGGVSFCHLTKTNLDPSLLPIGCHNHIYTPALVSAQLIVQQESGCIYRKTDGVLFANCATVGFPSDHPSVRGQDLLIYTSKELRENIKSVSNIAYDIARVVDNFGGEVIPEGTAKKWDSGKLVDPRLQDI